MTDGPNVRKVDDARQLLELAELSNIVFYEITGRRTLETNETPLSIQILMRREDLVLEVRARAMVSGAGGEYIADASAIFSLEEPIDASDEVIQEFVERVGVMSVYPYLREAVTSTAAKLGLDRPILKLLRPGDVHVTPSDHLGD